MEQDLNALKLLALDCQTTGSSPAKGHLLEVGWSVTSAAAPHAACETALVRLPRGVRIPPAITRLTGITPQEMRAAIPRAVLWKQLLATGHTLCVAHFARFEQQFLEHLHAECAPQGAFPLRFLCTHEISRRLLPDLPRRSLRAVAGYFGHPLPESKRAGAHVDATIHVWAGLVRLLRDQGIETLEDLCSFLGQAPPRRAPRWSYPLPRETRLALADKPGVYRFLDARGRVLYVGKAASLHKRVNSYFRKRRAEDKLLELVSQARDVSVTETQTALEAALLEVDEIKRLDPPYNRALRGGDPSLWFVSADLRYMAPQRDTQHPLGPFPNRDLWRQVHALSRILNRRRPRVRSEIRTARDLGLQPRGLEPGALAIGIDAFAEAYDLDRRPDLSRELLAIGRGLWMERLEAEVEQPTEVLTDDEEDVLEEAGRGTFDPEGVMHYLECLACTAHHHHRRALWLGQVAEAIVRWEPAGAPAAAPNELIVRGGSIQAGDRTSRSNSQPDWKRPSAARLGAFDRTTYDRLRVLTTEIRRILSQNRDVEIRLGPKRCLGTQQLIRTLRWV